MSFTIFFLFLSITSHIFYFLFRPLIFPSFFPSIPYFTIQLFFSPSPYFHSFFSIPHSISSNLSPTHSLSSTFCAVLRCVFVPSSNYILSQLSYPPSKIALWGEIPPQTSSSALPFPFSSSTAHMNIFFST